MQYPKFLQKNDCIGLVAPSFGCNEDPYATRLESAISILKRKGFAIKEGKNIRSYKKVASTNAKDRAKEFMETYLDNSVNFVSSVAGGERMIEILDYIDFEAIKKAKPKYFMGYSDNTVLTFTLTTLCDIASIYYVHIPELGMKPWSKHIENGFSIITGKKNKLEAYTEYEIPEIGEHENTDKKQLEDYLAPYDLNGKTKWFTLDDKEVTFTGRLIGGCLDVLQLLCGTEFADISSFQNTYKDDGFIWYLETCDLNAVATLRALWQLKHNNFFMNVKGFLIGKPLNGDDFMDLTYEEAVMSVLSEFNVPIIFDVNVGHISPTIPMLNGFLATVQYNKNESSIMFLK
ncbi:MAG: hypothetical protein BKP49_09585 [Treponema sp. CETP13]|nr:MAG: hypothetical protein BKP49_09585 [Treponema sp. CETP13]